MVSIGTLTRRGYELLERLGDENYRREMMTRRGEGSGRLLTREEISKLPPYVPEGGEGFIVGRSLGEQTLGGRL